MCVPHKKSVLCMILCRALLISANRGPLSLRAKRPKVHYTREVHSEVCVVHKVCSTHVQGAHRTVRSVQRTVAPCLPAEYVGANMSAKIRVRCTLVLQSNLCTELRCPLNPGLGHSSFPGTIAVSLSLDLYFAFA